MKFGRLASYAAGSLAMALVVLGAACGGGDDGIENVPTPGASLDYEQLRSLVQEAVASSAPENISREDVQAMVMEAVQAANADDITTQDLEAMVSQAVQDAIAQQERGLTAEETRKLINDAVSSLPDAVPAQQIGEVSIMHQWVSGGEPESFEAVVAPWQDATGGQVNATGTRDIKAILVTRVRGGNPPDIAALAAPGDMETFARDGELVPLDSFLDMDTITSDYSQTWLDLCTVDGNLYCIPYKASNKSTVWYDPQQFEDNGWEEPATWDEMIQLSDQILQAGQTPWSMGLESGGSSGWPGTDWIAQIILSESGPEVYDQWVNHEIPWTDPAVRSAWEKFGQILHTQGYIPGGPIFALSTNFTDAAYLPFRDPPQAQMYFLGSFAQGFIQEQFPDAQPNIDYSFFPFPTINPGFEGAVTGGADLIVMFNDTPSARSLMGYLASAGAQQIWVSRGGFTSTNNKVSLSAYPDPVAAKVAEQLTQASIFRFDADDIWGGSLQQAFWQGILDYTQDPTRLDSILQNIEQAAVDQLGPVGQSPSQ